MEFLQGNTYLLQGRFYNKETGAEIDGTRVVRAEFAFNDLRFYYGTEDATVEYDRNKNAFIVGLTEEQTLGLKGTVKYQSKALLDDGSVSGTILECSYIYDTICRTILGDNISVGEENGKILKLRLSVQGGGEGGTSNYNELENKPQINGVELRGNKTSAELGITSPTKLSELENDAGYITSQDLPAIPSKTSELENDSDFTTNEIVDSIRENLQGQIDTNHNNIETLTSGLQETDNKVTELENDLDAHIQEAIQSFQDIGASIQEIEGNVANVTETADTALSIAKGANQSVSFEDYQVLVNAFNSFDDKKFNVGQNVMIVKLEVPDLWVSDIFETAETYTYSTDTDFINALKQEGYVQIGYYALSALETQKVDLTDYAKKTDLTNYVKNTDYATNAIGGVVKVNSASGISISNGLIQTVKASDSVIASKTNTYHVITPSNLDYAIKVGLTTNTKSLTEQEQQAFKTWMNITEGGGALPKITIYEEGD